MDVKISDPTTVYPLHQPFSGDHTLPLSHLDTDRNMNVPFRYVRAYAGAGDGNQHSDPFSVITGALSAVLVKYYPYTGSLRRRNLDGRFELRCTVGAGVNVIPATVDFALSSVKYLDDADEGFIELLVPNPDQETRLSRLLILQVTRFSCGGFTLGASVHHVLCDGLGATLFFNAMAEIARGVGEVTVEPVWDRLRLLGPREPARTEFPIGEFLCLDKEFVPYSELSEPVIRECFNVNDERLDRFKRSLHEESGLSFTTFEALGAFLWQASGDVMRPAARFLRAVASGHGAIAHDDTSRQQGRGFRGMATGVRGSPWTGKGPGWPIREGEGFRGGFQGFGGFANWRSSGKCSSCSGWPIMRVSVFFF